MPITTIRNDLAVTNDLAVIGSIYGSMNRAATDAFGRARVSSPQTIFDSQMQYDKQPLLWVEKLVGNGTATHVPAESAVDLEVTPANGDTVIRQTRQYIRYQPGKSQLILVTCVFGADQSGTTKLVGYGDGANGVFMGQDGGGMFVLLRSSSSGSLSDARKVYSADWSIDKMNGRGASRVTLDATKSMIVAIDIEWLGVGSVRVGVVVDGQIYYVHQFNNANNVALTYMTTANLPVRYEIKNTSAVAAAAALKQICASVISEGGQDFTAAYPFQRQVLGVSMGNGAANEAVIFAVRHAATFNSIENRAEFRPSGFTISAAGGTIIAKVFYNPTITAGTWAAVDALSVMEANSTASGYTGGTQISGSIVAAASVGQAVPNVQSKSLAGRLPFGLDIDGANPVTLALVAYGTGSGITGNFLFDWEEVR